MSVPTINLISNSDQFINQDFTLNLQFSNTGSQIGFNPFYDIVLPKGLILQNGNLKGIWNEGLSRWETSGGSQITEHTESSSISLPVDPSTNMSTNIDGSRWYVIDVPYSSYGPSQPELDIEQTLHFDSDDGAIIDQQETIYVTPHFKLGHDAQNNPNNDPAISGTTKTANFTPKIIIVSKRNNAPESEIATGENFPFKFFIDISVADGLDFQSFTITDILPNTLQFISDSTSIPAEFGNLTKVTSSPSAGEYKEPQFMGDTFEVNFSGLIQTISKETLTLSYQVYVPYKDANEDLVLSETYGTSRGISNNASVSTQYRVTGSGDDFISINGSDSDTVTAKSIAIQKSNNVSGYSMPNDIIDFTLSVQVSDYFMFDTITLKDVLSDGLSLHSSSASYTLNEQSSTTNSNLNISSLVLGDSTTELNFNIDQAFTQLKGSDIDVGVTGISGSPSHSGTTMTITYQAKVDTSYKGSYTNPEVDIGDYMSNSVTIDANVYDHFNDVSYGNNVADTSSSNIPVGSVTITKSIYAVNGTLENNPTYIYPNDDVTYRLRATLSHQNVENFIITDYLPPPIMLVTNFSNLTIGSQSATPPAAHGIQYGSLHTFDAILTPTVTTSSSANSLTFTFGTHQTETGLQSYEIDIMYTITANDSPVVDGLLMTNQYVLDSTNTMTNAIRKVDSVGVRIGEPVLEITKIVAAYSSTSDNARINPTLDSSLNFGVPGDNGGYSSNNITSTFLSSSAWSSNHEGRNLYGKDLARFAIVIENQGSHPGHNIKVTDTGNSTFNYQSGSLRLTDAVGTTLNYTGDLFGDGLTITESIPAYHETNGLNIFIITYDMELDPTETQAKSIPGNTAEVDNYASVDSGSNFLANKSLLDTTEINTAGPSGSKEIVSTSQVHTGNTTSTAYVAIGEKVSLRSTITLPVGLTRNLSYTDYISSDYVIHDVAISTTGNLTSSLGSFDTSMINTSTTPVVSTLGDVTNSGTTVESIYIDYTVEFTDIPEIYHALVNDEDAIISYQYINDSNQTKNRNTNINGTEITVLEPTLTIDKTTSTSNHNNIGDSVVYDITVTNSSNVKAFEIDFTDTLPSELDFIRTTLGSHSGGVITHYVDSLEPWASFNLSVTCTLNSTLVSGKNIVNTAQADWKSIPTESPYSGREYSTTGSVTIVSLPTLGVTVSNQTFDHANKVSGATPYGSNLKSTIGDLHYLKSVITVPRAQVPLNDIEMIISNGDMWEPVIEGLSATASSLDLDVQTINVTQSNSTNTLTLQLDTTVNNSNTDSGVDETYTLTNTFDIANHLSNQKGETITITPRLTLDGYAGYIYGSAVTIDIVEPELVISKDMTRYPESITDYVDFYIQISNPNSTNATTAQDIVFTDDFSTDYSAISIINISNNGITTDNSSFPNASLSITKLDPGETLTFTIRATLAGNRSLYDTLTNTATVTYTSVEGADSNERIGDTGVNDYITTDQRSFYIGPPEVTLSLVNGSEYTVGEEIEYRARIRLQPGTFTNMSLENIIPTGMELLTDSITVSTTGTGFGGVDFNGTVGVVSYDESPGEWIISTVTNSNDNDLDNDYFDLIFKTYPKNSAEVVQDYTMPGRVRLYYNDQADVRQSVDSNSVNITIKEPNIDVTVSRIGAAQGEDILLLGQRSTFTVTVSHNGSSYDGASTLIVSGAFPADISVLSASVGSGSITGINTTSSTFGFDVTSLPLGSSATLNILAKVSDSSVVNTDLNITSSMTWKGNATDGSNARDGTNGQGGLNDYASTGQHTIQVTDNGQSYSGTIMVEDIIYETSPGVWGDFDYNDIMAEYYIDEIRDTGKVVKWSILINFIQQRAAYDHDIGLIIPGITTYSGSWIRQRFNGNSKETFDSGSISAFSSDRVPLLSGLRSYIRKTGDQWDQEIPASVKMNITFDENNRPDVGAFNSAEPPFYPYVDCYIGRLSDGNPNHTVQYYDGSVLYPNPAVPHVLVLKDMHDMYTCNEGVDLDVVNPYYRTWLNAGQNLNDHWWDTNTHPPVQGTFGNSVATWSAFGDGWKNRVWDI